MIVDMLVLLITEVRYRSCATRSVGDQEVRFPCDGSSWQRSCLGARMYWYFWVSGHWCQHDISSTATCGRAPHIWLKKPRTQNIHPTKKTVPLDLALQFHAHNSTATSQPATVRGPGNTTTTSTFTTAAPFSYRPGGISIFNLQIIPSHVIYNHVGGT